MDEGDCLTCTAGLGRRSLQRLRGARLVRFLHLSPRRAARERTAARYETLEAARTRIINRRESGPPATPARNFLAT